MSEPTGIAVLETSVQRKRQSPAEAVIEAKEQADALMQIVRATKISKRIGDKEYLQVEAWQTIARFNRCWIDTDWTRDIKDGDGRVLGVEARGRLVRLDDGVVLGGAEAACMMDEEFARQDGSIVERWSDYYAVKSMAQTRAQGKVGRMAFAWVAVLGGYATTPAEEMTGVEGPRVPFGRDKGKLVSELTDKKDLAWLADAIAKSIADPEKKRYKPQNERLHGALVTRLAELDSPATPTPPAKDAGSAVETPSAAPAVDPSWHEKLQVEVTAVQTERDPKKLVLAGLLSAMGLTSLADVKTQAEGVKLFAEYLKRTGKGEKQGSIL